VSGTTDNLANATTKATRGPVLVVTERESLNHERSTRAITVELSEPGLRCIITETLFFFSTSVTRLHSFLRTTPANFIFIFAKETQNAQMYQAGFAYGILEDESVDR
jgi:hypothetical protein